MHSLCKVVKNRCDRAALDKIAIILQCFKRSYCEFMPAAPTLKQPNEGELSRTLGLFDSTMIVAGSMIGTGIFIVAAEMSRLVGSAGWLLVSWVITGLLTVAAALSYGELAAMMPRAGGQYVYLR